MHTVTVTRTIDAPIEQVFALLADGEGYKQIAPRAIRTAKLVRQGVTEKFGVGALREFDARVFWFREEITAFEAPNRIDYHIRASRPQMDHLGGFFQLDATPAGTKVTWTSTYRVPVPLVGALAEKLVAGPTALAFTTLLRGIDAACQATKSRS